MWRRIFDPKRTMPKEGRPLLGFGLFFLGSLALGSSVLAQQRLSFPLTHFKLRNGLQVILSEDFSLPLVSVAVAYDVGSVHEVSGKTGLAYLMENLMFSGSANVSPRQHINYINWAGGQFNAAASEDMTLFYQTVPSNQLALVLWLESDRMKSLELSEAEFEKARNDHLDDLRQRKMADPYLESSLSFDQLLYSDFAYSHPLLGTEDDVRNLTFDDVKSFYSTYYVPNNAVLCITGNFNKLKARELVARYFETIPAGKDVSPSLEPWVYTKKQVLKSFENVLTSAPAFHLGFRIGSPSSNDFYVLSIIDYILLRGQSSRLTRRLMNRNNKIAYQLSGGIEKKKDRAVYKIFGVVNTPMMADQCLEAIFSELDRLKTAFLSEDELARYKNMFKQDYLGRFSSSMEKAIFLCESYLTIRNFDDLPLELDRYLNVTKNDIVGIINRYFTADNSIVLNIKTK